MKKLILFMSVWSLFLSVVATENVYFTAQGKQAGKPVIYRSMDQVPIGQKEADYPTLINIYWPFDVNANNGMPDPQTNADQIKFEDALEQLDKNGVSHLMLVVTGNGRKEWIWYVKDVEGWMSKFNELLSGHPVYPIDLEISEEPTWSTYHEFVAGVKGK